MNPLELNNSDLARSKNHISNVSNNILNLSETRSSALSIRYISYFYHLFPLHLNSFTRLFSDVIRLKLNKLDSCLTEFINLSSDIHSFYSSSKDRFTFLYKLFVLYKNLINSLSYDFSFFIEPYIKILIDALDHDIDVLTNLHNYLNIFNHFYDSLSCNIKQYYKIILCNIMEQHGIEIRFHHKFTQLSKLINILGQIKSKLLRFNDYQSIRKHYYLIKLNEKLVKDTKCQLESFKSCLQSIQPSQADYINKIKEKLRDYEEPKFYYLYNIEKLLPVESSRQKLYNLRQNMKDIIEDIKYHKQQLPYDNIKVLLFLNYTPYIVSKPFIQFFDTIKSLSVDSIKKYFTGFQSYQTLQSYTNQITNNIAESKQIISNLISEVNVLIEYIPNLTQKLKDAKSKLDKKHHIQLILNKIEIIEIVTTALDVSKYILVNAKVEEEISKFILYFKSLKNTLKLIDFVMARLMYIKNDIFNLTSLKLNISLIKEHTLNIKYNINKITIMLNILDQKVNNISKIINEITTNIKFAKNFSKELKITPFEKYIDYVINDIYLIKTKLLVNINITINNLMCFKKKLESKLNLVEGTINDFECEIEDVPRTTIRCSLKSVSNHLTNYDNQLLINYSMISVVQYNVVVNKLYESARKLDTIIQLIPLPDGCKCISYFESKERVELGVIYVHRVMEKLTSDGKNQTINEMVKVHQMNSLYGVGMYGNNLCICMVNKYILYPQLLKLFYLLAVDLEMLSTTSRKYDNYVNFTSTKLEMAKVFMLVIDVLYKISQYILSKYTYSWTGRTTGVEIKCFCTYHQDQNYHLILSLMLFLSSLIENTWATDNHAIVTEIRSLSSLLSEFELRGETSYSSNNLNILISSIYNIIMIKQTEVENGSKTMALNSQSLSLKYQKSTINIINAYFKSLISLITKLNLKKHQVNSYYQIFSTLIFQIIINSGNNKIKINRQINMYISNMYLAILKQMCSNNHCKEVKSCKCATMKIYTLAIMMSYLYNKLISETNVINETLKTINDVTKIEYGATFKIMKTINTKMVNIIYLLKNNYRTYTHHKNIANSFPSLTMGYGYENVY